MSQHSQKKNETESKDTLISGKKVDREEEEEKSKQRKKESSTKSRYS